MNFYEELGLRPDASPEQIRQAYRNLVRLLHPDQQTGESLRRLAERQMRRLNAIRDTLIEPAQRREYDAGLSQSVMVVETKSPWTARRAISFSFRDAGLVAAGIAVASLYWQLSATPKTGALRVGDSIPRPVASEPVRAGTAGQKPVPRVIERQARIRRERAEEQDVGSEASARPAMPQPRVEQIVEPAAGPAAAEVTRPPVIAVPAPVSASPEKPAADAALRFGGTWVYVRPRLLSSQQSLYPADYVETVISEEGDTLRGRYRARYDVADRPISAEVAFRFEGRAEDDGASLTWTGAGGAEGAVKLVILSRNSMRLDWVATTLGTHLGLASGTAVLTRRQEK